MTISARCTRFRALHQSGCFVLPNPWDLGTARVLVQLGFQAVATTSCGLAWALGVRDHAVTLEQKLAHLREISAAVDVPVNADFERGFAVEPANVAANVTAATSTGVAGLSIEDSTGDPAAPLVDLQLAIERVRAAREAIDRSGTGVLLTGRSEGFLVGRPDLPETIRRLTAYAEAGADCLFAPGLRTLDEVRAVVEAVAPRPVNVLMGSGVMTVEQLASVGVRRISVGGGLARAAWTGFLSAAREIAEHRTFSELGRAVSYSEVNTRFPA
jgi:methylisocitrate lyase